MKQFFVVPIASLILVGVAHAASSSFVPTPVPNPTRSSVPLPTPKPANASSSDSSAIGKDRVEVKCNNNKDALAIVVIYANSDTSDTQKQESKIEAQCVTGFTVKSQIPLVIEPRKALPGQTATGVWAKVSIPKPGSWFSSTLQRIKQSFSVSGTDSAKTDYLEKQYVCEFADKQMSFILMPDGASIRACCGNTCSGGNAGSVTYGTGDAGQGYDQSATQGDATGGSTGDANGDGIPDQYQQDPCAGGACVDDTGVGAGGYAGSNYGNYNPYSGSDYYNPYAGYDAYSANATGSATAVSSDGEDYGWGGEYDTTSGSDDGWYGGSAGGTSGSGYGSTPYGGAAAGQSDLVNPVAGGSAGNASSLNTDVGVDVPNTPTWTLLSDSGSGAISSWLAEYTNSNGEVQWDQMELDYAQLEDKYPGWSSIFSPDSYQAVQYYFPDLTEDEYSLMSQLYANHRYSWTYMPDTIAYSQEETGYSWYNPVGWWAWFRRIFTDN